MWGQYKYYYGILPVVSGVWLFSFCNHWDCFQTTVIVRNHIWLLTHVFIYITFIYSWNTPRLCALIRAAVVVARDSLGTNDTNKELEFLHRDHVGRHCGFVPLLFTQAAPEDEWCIIKRWYMVCIPPYPPYKSNTPHPAFGFNPSMPRILLTECFHDHLLSASLSEPNPLWLGPIRAGP